MHRKSTKKISFKATKIARDFTSENLTGYSGLSAINDYANHPGVFEKLDKQFLTPVKNATKILNVQIFSAIIFANMSGIFRLSKISSFMKDSLVSKILHLKGGFEDSNLKSRLVQLGERGAHELLETGLNFSRECIAKCGLSRITIDCDSTEGTVFGNQEGAEKGYNPGNKGKRCYHPLICFCSEMKIVINSWFRPGNTYTANGIVEFMKQTLASLPPKVKKVFFRADSGFFCGQLFDLLEEKCHEYLVKAKLTPGIKLVLSEQKWDVINSHTAICEFEYKAHGWSKARKMYAVRMVKETIQKDFFGFVEQIPVHEYFCYCSNLKGLDSIEIHQLYGGRAECENWIENTKNQLCAGKTVTDNFYVNDILWQLSIMAYNLSVIMRYEADYKVWRQEPKTFQEWFISIPGKVITNARKTTVKMSKHYIYAKEWVRFADKIPIAA
jgi:hypothetical protein